MEIRLLKYRGKNSSLFTGRPQGEDARKELKLDNIDNSDDEILLIIPKGTTSFNPSFYLGLLYMSIKNIGIEKFKTKYKFVIEDDNENIRAVLNNNLADGLRNAENSIKKKSSFFNLFKKI